MTLAFQDSLLKYLFREKEAKQFKEYLDQSLFDVPMFQTIFSLWFDYVTKYNNIPPKANFLEFTDREVKRSKGRVSADKYTEMLNTIAVVYTPDNSDYNFNKEAIILFAKRKGLRNLFTANADRIKNASYEELDDIANRARDIASLRSDREDAGRTKGRLMFADVDKPNTHIIQSGHPTFLHGINKTTAARGFHSPQLILLMGGPKAFKTGTLLSIMVEYARAGLNVYIADFENGVGSIEMRIKQCLLECERGDVNNYTSELKSIIKKIRIYGGDIRTDFYPAGISNLDHVDANLELYAAEGWIPNVIFYDYLRLAKSANKKIYDVKEQLQDVYYHAIRLNNKYGCFAFNVAKVKQDAVNKLVIKTTDFGEDFAQAYNCHAAFALCRTENEERDGYGRIVPVLQREGTGYRYGASTTCAVKIVPETQTVTELDADSYMATLEEEHEAKSKQGSRRKYISPKDLKDD